MLLAVAGSAAAQAAPQDGPKFEFHGFVGASVYTENSSFNNGGGQAAWVVTGRSATTGEPTTDTGVFGGDVRQTRLNFSLTGSQLAGETTPRAFAEIDFFGGNTPGGFGDISIAPRLRIAFAELKIGKTSTMIRAGQDHDLTLGIVLPATVGHVAFPLSYQAGTIGWRRPGIAVYQSLPVADMKLEVAVAVGRSGWSGATPTEERLGVSSAMPSFQGRFKLQGKIFEAFVAGHSSTADVTGQGVPGTSIETNVITAGGKVSYMGVSLAGAAYKGKNLAPLAGNLLQWQPAAALAPDPVDVSEVGGWAQLGYNLTPTISAFALAGFANPDDEDLVRATLTRGRNVIVSGLLRYQSKGYAAGLEYTRFRTSYTNTPDPATNVAGTLDADQFMLSGMYFF